MNDFGALLFRFSLGLFCHALLLPAITSCRFGRRVCYWAWFGMAGLGTVLVIPLIVLVKNVGTLFVVEAVFTLILYGGACVFLSEGSRMRSLFAFSVYGTYFMFLLTFASCLSQSFFAGSHYATTAIRTVFLAFYGLFLYFSPLMDSFRKTSDLEMGWWSPAIFSCASCLTVYTTALTFAILQVAVGIRLVVSAALLFLITSAYVVASRAIALLNRDREFQTAEAQRRLLESQLAAEREFVAQARAYRHDMRHHTALLADYLERKDYGGMRDYLAQFRSQLDADALEAYCENPVADALLRLTARRCRTSGIPLAIRAAVPETLCLSGPELTTVLGNVLENAWESCRSADKPRLSVRAQVKGGTLLVEVENTVDHPPCFEDDLPVTTKPGGGQGLKAARRTLEKHGGMLCCSQQEDVFYTQMTIPLEESKFPIHTT